MDGKRWLTDEQSNWIEHCRECTKWNLDGKRMIDRWAKAIELEAAKNVMQVGLTIVHFFVHIEEHSRLDSIGALQPATCHLDDTW
jgi:hypothetical protein